MPRAILPTGIELEYRTAGDPDHETLLVINGYTAQMISWRSEFVDQLVAQDLFVVQFDNRDCGLSSKLDGQSVRPMKVLSARLEGTPVPEVPYTLSDMAGDGVGLLDHLGVDRAHIVGNSMGGMIVQTMAIEYPERVASATSIMSSPSDPAVGAPTKEATKQLLLPPPTGRDEYVAQALGSKEWRSKKYYDPIALQSMAGEEFDRGVDATWNARQLAAIYASGDRSEALATLDIPMLVIHGRDDTLITPEGGARTADLVAGSRYLLLADMGHDMPPPLWPVFAEVIGGHVRSSIAMSGAG